MKSLQAAFDFTDEDLAANRVGRVSERQIRRAKDRRRLGFVYLIGALVPPGLIAYFVPKIPELMLIAMVLCIGLLAVAGIIFLQSEQWSETLPPVLSVSGPVALSLYEGEGYDIYGVDVDKRHFDLKSRQYKALRSGYRYRFYYTDWPRAILSAESLDGEIPPAPRTTRPNRFSRRD